MVQVGLTFVTHFGMGMVIFTSSTRLDSERGIGYLNMWNGNITITFFPVVCFFGPT